jgi:hypothetical protein
MGPACTAYLQDTIISLDGNGHLLFTFIFILFFFFGAWDQTQGLIRPRQMLYH